MFRRVAQQVHHAEGADDRQRHRDRGNDGGGQVAQEEEDHHHHQGDGEHQLKLHVPDRGANGDGAVGEHLHLHGGRHAGLQLRQQLLDAVHHGDDVGARLALDIDDDRGLAVHPGGLLGVFGGIDDRGHVGGAHRGSIAIGHDHRLVIAAGKQLVVGADGVGLAIAVQRALGLVHVGRGQGGAQIFQAQVVGGQLRRIGLNAHRGLLPAGDRNQSHAGNLRNLLRQVGVGRVLDLVQRQRVGGQRQRHDGRVGGVHLAIDGRIGQIGGQKAGGRVDGRLHLLLGHVDVLVQIEFERNHRAAAAS